MLVIFDGHCSRLVNINIFFVLYIYLNSNTSQIIYSPTLRTFPPLFLIIFNQGRIPCHNMYAINIVQHYEKNRQYRFNLEKIVIFN